MNFLHIQNSNLRGNYIFEALIKNLVLKKEGILIDHVSIENRFENMVYLEIN